MTVDTVFGNIQLGTFKPFGVWSLGLLSKSLESLAPNPRSLAPNLRSPVQNPLRLGSDLL